MSIYDKVTTLALKKGERTFPFYCFGDVDIDWDKVYDEWVKVVKYCKRHHIYGKKEEEQNYL